MDTPWVTSAALKPLLTMTQRMRCDPHGPSHRTLTNRGFGDQGREPRSCWAEVYNGCMRASLEA